MNEVDFAKEYDRYVTTSFGALFPIIMVEASGVYLKDVDGKKYLDFWAGIATVNAGHNNPIIQEAVKNQMEKLVHCASQSYYTLPPLELAKQLTTIAPFKKCKATFHTSGSEANDVALKMVRRHTKKHEILTLQGSYHGQTYGSRSLSTPVASYTKDYAMGPWLPGVIHVPAPYCYRCSLNLTYPDCQLQCAKMIEHIITFSTSRNVAALMIEPILGVGGIVVPPEDYLQEVKKVLDKHSILLVLDEVQTGLGRTGKFWAADTFMVQPDVMTLAKALGNGWPIAAVVASDPIENSFEAGDHFSTWGASPVMCAAALATIDFIIEHRLWKNAAKMGNLMMARLKELEDAYNVIGEARGKGLMIGLEIVKDPISKVPGVEECKAIRSICANSGLIIGTGGFWSNVIRIQPPLTIGKENVEEGLNILEDAIRGVEKQAE